MNRQNQFELIEKLLVTEEPLVPSSGFLASVMERVTEEAAVVHRPLEFPWRRVVPGFVLIALLLLVGLKIYFASLNFDALQPGSFLSIPHLEFAVDPKLAVLVMQLPWLMLGAGVTLLSLLFARRMIGSN